ncbi:hypothetical protein X777_10091 [Ooceraea biroi]|uniref:Uncharacterized protein n=1 Tax=Ooceraea biroi TaxID=2015173 RepID=A0A026X367_OOCBI|nr:hypothetical protein X777_10091 [Ooceraea biroi]
MHREVCERELELRSPLPSRAARCGAARINYKVYASEHERVVRGVGVYVRSSPWDERERTTREQGLTTRSNKCCRSQPATLR